MALSIKQIEEALKLTGGFVTKAAERLGVTSQAISMRIKRSPQLQAIKDEIEKSWLDKAESKLMDQIESGNLGAICFYLKCKGKSRGYIEKEIEKPVIDNSEFLKKVMELLPK